MSSKRYRIYKENDGDKVWWVDNYDVIGENLFTFDKKKIYNLFRDYPHKLSVEEWLTFNEENPYWKEFFEDRNFDYAAEHIEDLKKLGRLDVLKDYT